MSLYGKNHYTIVISLQLIKINGKKNNTQNQHRNPIKIPSKRNKLHVKKKKKKNPQQNLPLFWTSFAFKGLLCPGQLLLDSFRMIRVLFHPAVLSWCPFKIPFPCSVYDHTGTQHLYKCTHSLYLFSTQRLSFNKSPFDSGEQNGSLLLENRSAGVEYFTKMTDQTVD